MFHCAGHWQKGHSDRQTRTKPKNLIHQAGKLAYMWECVKQLPKHNNDNTAQTTTLIHHHHFPSLSVWGNKSQNCNWMHLAGQYQVAITCALRPNSIVCQSTNMHKSYNYATGNLTPFFLLPIFHLTPFYTFLHFM